MNSKDATASYYYDLAVISGKQKKYDEVVTYCLKALNFEPDNILIHYAIATAYRNLNNYQEAIKHYSKAVEISPDNPYARHARATVTHLMLLSGNFKEGWVKYEDRLHFMEGYDKIKQSYWDGNDLNGKKIYVHSEQGLGDTLQFCRYLPMVRSKGGYVIFRCQPELKRLMQNVDGYDLLETSGDALVKDYIHVLLLSLPKLFKTEIATIPVNIPYIKVKNELDKKWKGYFGKINTLKIGFVWEPKYGSTGYFNRICPLNYFYELAKIPNLTLFSLQKNSVREKLQNLPDNIVDLSSEIDDFTDTAAIINNLDLIISIDTSVVHLAGAMGKPVWVLLPFNADWRWFLEREDSPWYPTMRLFRKTNEDDWGSVFNKIKNELKNEHKR